MVLIALVVGTSVSVSATERVTISLVAAAAIGWSFVPLAQLFTGLVLIRGSAGERLPLLNRYFATHRPWSLWIITLHFALLTSAVARQLGLWSTVTAVVPFVWTIWLLRRFCRDELGVEGRYAWLRVAVHQSVTYAVVLAYVFVAVALWPRILGRFA